MDFLSNNINLTIAQSSEVSKLKKKENDKTNLEQISGREKFIQKVYDNLVHDVESKDTEIPLFLHGNSKKKKKNQSQIDLEQEKKIKKPFDQSKGNFLDLKE